MLGQWVCHGALLCAAISFAQVSASEIAAPNTPVKESSGIVYVVLAVDTEPAGADGDGRRLTLNLSNFSDDSIRGYVRRVMSATWRTKYTDSFGGNPKLTWYVLTSEHICETGSCSAIFDEMQKFRTDLDRWGDEIGWHYHHTDFVKCTSPNRESAEWNQLTTFNGTQYSSGTDVAICENVLNHLIADSRFLPVSFRSGWVWENNDFSRWLDNVVPFDLSSSPPFVLPTVDPALCRSNESDWSRATLSWHPFNPDSADYQKSGSMARWLSRSLSKRFERRDLDSITANVFSGRDQLISVPLHSYSNMCNSFGNTLDVLCSQFDALGIRFKFATSAEAFAGVLKLKQSPPPSIQLEATADKIDIRISGDIFQSFPYVVARNSDSTLTRIIPHQAGRGHWTAEIADSLTEEVTVAVSSSNGASVVQSVRVKSPQH